MKYIELKNLFGDYITFSLNDIKKYQADFDLRRISEWIKKGYIKKIINKHYYFSDKSFSETEMFFISNKLLEPSYISLESALSYWGFIPEGVFSITAVSSKRKIKFETPLSLFTYNKIKPSMFFGYKLIKLAENAIKMAEPEKAIIDFLYLNPELKSQDDFYELRINKETAEKTLSRTKIKNYLSLIKDKSLNKRVYLLINYIFNDQSE